MRCLGVAVILIMTILVAHTESLQWAGVIGNSGDQGKAVVRGSIGRCGGGVYVDKDGHIYAGAGDRINVLDSAGKYLSTIKLPSYPERPEFSFVLGGPTFAVSENYLYFIAGPKQIFAENIDLKNPSYNFVKPNLMRVALEKDAVPEIIVPSNKIAWEEYRNVEFSLTPSADVDNPGIFFGMREHSSDPAKYTVYKTDNETCARISAFELPIWGDRIAGDEANNLYFGSAQGVMKYDTFGKPLVNFNVIPLPKTGETQEYFTQNFPGTVVLTRNAIWLMSRLGYLARYNRAMQANPGIVTRRNYALGYVGQIVDGPDDSYYIKAEDAVYQARIANNQLVLEQRFGSLPRVDALAITEMGEVGIGQGQTTNGMLWFAANATDPAAVPIRAEGVGPIAQGSLLVLPDGTPGMYSFSFAEPYTPFDFTPAPTTLVGRFFTPSNVTPPDWPFPRALGKTEFNGQLTAVTMLAGTLLGIDAKANTIVGSAGEQLQFAPVEGLGPFTGKLTSITALGNSLLLLADGNVIRAFSIKAGQVEKAWQMSMFGTEKDFQLGAQLYLAANNGHLLVADTKRHRVLLFACNEQDKTPPKLLAQFGETNKAGDDDKHLSSPTLVSLNSTTAVVYDSVNQRVVKLLIK